MLKRVVLVGGLLFACAPVLFLIPGCGGGGGGNGGGGSNTTQSASAPIRFSATQTGTLNVNRTGSNISGSVRVNAPTSPDRAPDAFTFVIPSDSYPLIVSITGTVNLDGSTFNATGTFPAPVGAFTIHGTLPTSSSAGQYSLTAAGQSLTGNFNSTTPTATPTPTATTTPLPATDQITLTYKDELTSNVNVETGAIGKFFGQVAPGSNQLVAIYDEGSGAAKPSRFITVSLNAPLTVGSSIAVNTTNTVAYGERTSASLNPVHNWIQLGGGTVKILSVTNLSGGLTKVQFQLINVPMKPDPAQTGAVGTFTLNGTGQITGTASEG